MFGAGAIGLLVAAVAKLSDAGEVVIADLDRGRLDFAVQNRFADRAYEVPMKQGGSVDENLGIAKASASAIGKVQTSAGGALGEPDVSFDCTGVPSCVQTSIYVGTSYYRTAARYLIATGNTPRRQSRSGRHGTSHLHAASVGRGSARG